MLNPVIEKLWALVEALIKAGFYGKFTIHFQNGKVVHCIKEESIKIE